jgi:hypothetical protein
MQYSTLSSNEIVLKVMSALEKNGVTSDLVQSGKEALERVRSLIPVGAEVLTMASITLEQTGIGTEINNSGNYISIRKKLNSLDRHTQHLEMQKIGAAPQWAVGSVQAITRDGQAVIASNSGSQLPGYAYGASHVVWVVSTKKIVNNYTQAMNRINEYIIAKETIRVRKAYGLPDTFHTYPSKVLIVNKEKTPGRIHVIFVNEDLGY